MKFRLITLVVWTGLTLNPNLFGQKSHSIEIFASPAIVQFGDLTDQYTELSNEHIKVNYSCSPSQEIGLNYLWKFESRFGCGFGLGWKHDVQKIEIGTQKDPNDWSTAIDHFFYRIELGNINLKLNLTYLLTDKIRIDFILNACTPYLIQTNVPQVFQINHGSSQLVITPDTSYQTNLFSYSLDIKSRGVGSRRLIPELRITSQLYKNLKLNFGTRIKCWESQFNYFDLEIDGYFGDQNSGNYEPLHRSSISTKEFSFFFGFSYDFPIKRNKENNFE